MQKSDSDGEIYHRCKIFLQALQKFKKIFLRHFVSERVWDREEMSRCLKVIKYLRIKYW